MAAKNPVRSTSEFNSWIQSHWDINANGTLYTWTRKVDQEGKSVPTDAYRVGTVCSMTYTTKCKVGTKTYVAYGLRIAGGQKKGVMTAKELATLPIIWVQESMQRNFGTVQFWNSIKQKSAHKNWLASEDLWDARVTEETNGFNSKGSWLKKWITMTCGYVMQEDSKITKSPAVTSDSTTTETKGQGSGTSESKRTTLPTAFGDSPSRANPPPRPPSPITTVMNTNTVVTKPNQSSSGKCNVNWCTLYEIYILMCVNKCDCRQFNNRNINAYACDKDNKAFCDCLRQRQWK